MQYYIDVTFLILLILSFKTDWQIVKVICILLYVASSFFAYENMLILYFVIGLVLAPSILQLSVWLTYHEKLVRPKRIVIDYSIIIDACYEELLWRSTILAFFINNNMASISVIVVLCIYMLLFVFVHSIKSLNECSEMMLFSIILTVCSYFFPGLNYGLHVGRNIFVVSLDNTVIN